MSTAARIPPSEPLAPWAEIVTGAPFPMSVDDLLHWPDDDGYRYEVVEGVLVRVAGSGKKATTIGLTIAAELRAYARPRRFGVATPADGVYKFPGAETGLLPDAGYYIAARDALVVDENKPIPFAPDLAAGVASPDQTQSDMDAKARVYLRGGTRLVWVVWPEREEVDVWRRASTARPAMTLARGDVLSGEDVIPGFALAVDEVFADPLA